MTVRLQPCNLNIHCLTYRTMVFGFFFSTSNLLCRRKTRTKFHVSSKRENANFPVETASDNRQTRKMAGKSWSRGPFAGSVFRKLDAEIWFKRFWVWRARCRFASRKPGYNISVCSTRRRVLAFVVCRGSACKCEKMKNKRI